MGTSKVGPRAEYGVAVVGGFGLEERMSAPEMYADVECVNPDGSIKWKTTMKNVVVNQGKGWLLNFLGGGTTQSMYMGLHSVTTASNSVLSNITASEVTGYGAARQNVTWATTYTSGTASASASFGFTTSTYTVSGGFLCVGTTASVTNGTAGTLYDLGQFGASQQVQSGNTLNVTVTLSFN